MSNDIYDMCDGLSLSEPSNIHADFNLGTIGCSWNKRTTYDDQNVRLVFEDPEEERTPLSFN